MIDPLSTPPSAPVSLISTTNVPNYFPPQSPSNRIAIIGTAPVESDEQHLVPFTGTGGKFLRSLLQGVGIIPDQCFLGHVCQSRPPGDDLSQFPWTGDRIQSGISRLRQDLGTFRPNVILAVGNAPMRALTGLDYGIKDSGYSVSEYRGSLMQCPYGKLVPTLHPASIFSGEYRDWVLLKSDCKRAFDESFDPALVLPQHHFDLTPSAYKICQTLDNWPAGKPAAADIEGGLQGLICMSIVCEPNHGFIIAFGQHSLEDQGRIYVSLSRWLGRSDIPKVFQNGLYDLFVLAYGFQMPVRGLRDDTMLKQWEIYPELPKGLDTQASLWTRQPQWKHLIAYSKKEQLKRAKAGVSQESEIRNKHYACCIDSSVTLECSLAQDRVLSGDSLTHYRFNMSLIPAMLYMQLKGFNYDKSNAALQLSQVKAELAECGTRLATRAGRDLRGEKGSLSSQRLAKCLYEEKGYPVQKSGRGPNAKITTDVDALLKLNQKFPNDPFLSDILLHRKLESTQETLEITTDPDGRVRCAYNLVGGDTGRVACYTSPTGSGANLQTVTKKLRLNYRADPGKHLAQQDLAGADGWTVAAHCLKHGDPTMWDDYTFGLKPALIIVLMYMGKIKHKTSREEILALSKAYKKWEAEHESEAWLYFACKRVQHATNYMVTPKTGVDQIMKDSYKLTGKPIYIDTSTFASLQALYFQRYPGLYQWHAWGRDQVFNGHNLKAASGHTRVFFSRRKSWSAKLRRIDADHDTLKEFLAHEPQANTTYACNLALQRLVYDPENRDDRGRYIIEPLHQVHDAVITQFPIERTPWAVAKLTSYFQNELVIANKKLIIPFEGAYGPSWGEQGSKYGGGEF